MAKKIKRQDHINIWIITQQRFSKFSPYDEPDTIYEIEELVGFYKENVDSYEQEQVHEFYNYKTELDFLKTLTPTELNKKADTALTIIERTHPFNQGDYLADAETYKQWLRNSFLKPAEASALTLGRNPAKVYEILESNDLGVKAIKTELEHVRREFIRLETVIAKSGKIELTTFINWIKSYDLAQSKVLEKYYSPISTLKTNLKKNHTKSGETKKQITMLKIIIGLAIAKFRYDPKDLKSPVARLISEALDDKNIKISDDTIRTYLNEAKEHLPDEY